jgi:hypothetical protein
MSKYQKGLTTIFYLIALAVGTGLLIQQYVNFVSSKNIGNSVSDRQTYIKDVGKILGIWYEINAWAIDSNANAIPSANIISQAAIIPTFGLRVESSKRLSKDGIDYHVIVAWLPSVSATGTSFNADTGVFTPGTPDNEVQYFMVNGYNVEAQKKLATSKQVERATRLLEGWFQGKMASATITEIGANWFRTPDCFNPNPNYLPCVDSYTALSTVMSAQGFSDTGGLLNAWGQPIYMLNTTPYEVNVVTNAPWGVIASGVAQSSN